MSSLPATGERACWKQYFATRMTRHGALAPRREEVPVGIGWRQPHYRELLERLPALEFLEVHSENYFGAGGAALATLERGRAHYPVSLHGVGLALGSAAGIDRGHLEQLASLVRRIEPVRVSDHASFARGRLAGTVVHAADLLPIPFSGAALDVLCRNVSEVQDRLGQRIAVENLSAYLSWRDEPQDASMAETVFLAELARRSGCWLLIDVNNIYVNALNAGLELAQTGVTTDPLRQCRDWLDRIPRDSVAEIHLAGHSWTGDGHGQIVIDDHGSRVCEAVWSIYAHAVRRFGPVPALLEWDTDLPGLDVLLQEAERARHTQGSLEAR